MPLEPIEEKDLDMKNKFTEKAPIFDAEHGTNRTEDVFASEKKTERLEGSAEKDAAYSKIVSKIKTQAPPTDEVDIKKDADIVGKLMDAESMVGNLVDIAMQKGVVHAVKVAKKLNDNYILDGFHDKLMMDEFHDALMKKGLIEEL